MLKTIFLVSMSALLIHGCQGSNRGSSDKPPITVEPDGGTPSTALTDGGQAFLVEQNQTVDSTWSIYQSLASALPTASARNEKELGAALAIATVRNSPKEPSEAAIRKLSPLFFEAGSFKMRTFANKDELITAINTISR